MKTFLLIDFENFRKNSESVFVSKKIKKPIWHKYNFKGLFNKVLNGTHVDDVIFYYAKVIEHKETKEKSKNLIEDRRLLKNNLESQGFKVVIAGRVRGFQETNTFLGFSNKLIFKEKGVDVKIALDMTLLVVDKVVETIILGSSDSDLQPAINEVKKRGGSCIYLGFEANSNKGMAFNCGRAILIRDFELINFISE
jgi:uncharacterized LabA/DUF88 family protein